MTLDAARPRPVEPPAPRPPPNPARRNETTRRAILDAAIDLVAASGFESLSMEAIAKRAGVGKQTIYRWWPSKGAVLLDAFMEHRVEARAGLPVSDQLDTGDLAADVRRLLRTTVAEFATPSFETPYRAMTMAVQNDPRLAEQTMARLVRPSLDLVRTWLAAAQARGQVRADADLDVATELLVGPLFHRWLLRTAALDEAYADALADAVILALLPGSGPHQG